MPRGLANETFEGKAEYAVRNGMDNIPTPQAVQIS